mgnify:CR=1 FL=1
MRAERTIVAVDGGMGDNLEVSLTGRLRTANALASRWPRDNTDRYRPITYGSSHIQAISFLPRGRVDTRTILTYGQAIDPTLRSSRDQTRLFSRERWVDFPFTRTEVRRAKIGKVVVRGR